MNIFVHKCTKSENAITSSVAQSEAYLTTGSPSLKFVLHDLYLYKDFVRELLDRVIYKTLYGNPLDFSKIYDIFMNDEIKLTYLLFSVYLSVLCSLRPAKQNHLITGEKTAEKLTLAMFTHRP